MREDMRMLSNRVDALLSANPNLKLQELAHSIGTDRHQIEHAIKQHYGFSFRELKKRARLKRILALLEEQPNRYIKEIASEVGFTPNYLSRFIRSMTGHSATELRCQ